MAYRNLFIQNRAHVSIKQEQLLIVTDEQTASASLEDVQAVLLESRQSSITVAALSHCAKQGVCVFVCDEKHLPCGVLTPYAQHSRASEVLALQMKISAATYNRLWKQIVQSKIENQARCLALCGKKIESTHLFSRAKAVQSADKTNQEAVAAAYYFKALFGQTFTREEDNGINSALNYGYAILRGAISRCVCAYGFLPALGIHHASGLNAFNLSDDLIEAFRPCVDLFVAENVAAEKELNSELKHHLFNILNHDILSGEQHHSIAYAIERMVQSYTRCIRNSKQQLLLPQLLAVAQHQYE